MPVLTLSMIVKNEERYLKECLESVKTVADEIVIVDTGSTDRTKEIALEYGAKVYDFEWVNDFSAARNFALSKSTGRWVLYLDADERLSAASLPELKKIIGTNLKNTYYCFINSIDETNNVPNVMQYNRLFLNSKRAKFAGRVHEQILDSLKLEKYNVLNSKIEIIHIGYNVPRVELKVKAKRNLEYLLEDYKENRSAYNTFQLAQTYAVMGDMTEAENYFAKVLEISNSPLFYRAHANRFIASRKLDAGNVHEALDYVRSGLKLDSSQPLLNYLAAKIFLNLSDYSSALNHSLTAYQSNHSKKGKQFEIYIADSEIVFVGLKAASLAGNKEGFNFLYEALKNINGPQAADNKFAGLVWILFNNKPVSAEDAAVYAQAADEKNFELLISLLQQYQNNEGRFLILSGFPQRLKARAEYLTLYASALVENNMPREAIQIYETLMKSDNCEPSVPLFLTSVYVTLGEFDKIPALLAQSEKKFASQPEVIARLGTIKEQIAEFINQ